MDFWGKILDDQAYVIYNLTLYHDRAHWKLGGISSYTSTPPKYIVQRSPFRERKKWCDKTGDILKYENVTWLLNRGQLMDNHDNKYLNPFKCSAIVYSRSVIFTEFHHQKYHIFLLIFDIWLIFHLRLKYKWIAVEHKLVRRVGRYQGGNQNPYIEEEQTTQWPKEKLQRTNNDLQNIHIKLKID